MIKINIEEDRSYESVMINEQPKTRKTVTGSSTVIARLEEVYV